MSDDKLMEGMYFSDRCAFCSEFGEKKRPHVCERCFIAAMELAASEHPTPPPQVVRGEGDDPDRVFNLPGGEVVAELGIIDPDFRDKAEKLAGLVDTYIGPDGLRSTTPFQAVEEIRYLAALLAPKGKTS